MYPLEKLRVSVRKPQILKGFRDYTPDQMRLRLHVIGIFRQVFERHGFEPVDTPALEYLEILTGKAGENEKLMYHFHDQGDREVGLRYDLTVPLARYFAMHQQDSVLPFKRYHIAPVWRAEKPQRGRFREFWQCDADIVGSSSMLADAEAVSVLTDALDAVNLKRAVVSINHRTLLEAMARLAGVPESYAPTVFRAIDKLDKIGPDGVRRDLVATGVDEAAANRVVELVTRTGSNDELLDAAAADLDGIAGGSEAVTELRELAGYIDSLNVRPGSWKIDLSLARGIDYYTGPVFEARVAEPKVGSVAGAGR
ncbi:MAG: histidine--tRNA ligase family protein [Chloroflexota bacterium]|nr:histidine--tRNA ligase family protein [Chloroflexota bacterium]